MTESPAADEQPYTGHTVCSHERSTPLGDFLRTETASAVVLLAATVAALVWANAAPGSYDAFCRTVVSLRIGRWGVSLEVREWVNSGLMTFFFFVVGLEARREFDMGELRERRRVALPLLAGLSGMLVPVAVYLAVNAGRPTAHGWGAAMSTDTAFALGMLTLLGSRFPARLHTFILTVAVVDDLLALAAIAVVYSGPLGVPALLTAIGLFGVILLVRAVGVRHGAVYALLGALTWLAMLESGVDPVVVGLTMGLLTYAYPAARSDLEHASRLFRSFREQPTPELERSVRQGLAAALSPNERLLQLHHPWTSYLLVPLFALVNAGVTINGELLSRAFTSPVTLGILLAYLLGKPVGIIGSTGLAALLSRGRLHPPVGWGAVAGGGTIAGVGFTVSLLIAALAFTGDRLEEAKVGVLAAVVCAFAATWAVAGVIALLPRRRQVRALLGTDRTVIDLAAPVDPERDHVRGPLKAPVTVVEYGDLECPYCGLAEPVVRELLADFGDVRYVWRHLPLPDVHPSAQLAAEATEAAAEQGAFWEMHDRLMEHQGALRLPDLLHHAEEMGLDLDRFHRFLRTHAGAGRVAEDVDSADLSGVAGTPTFFVNGRRHHGAYDIDGLSAAVRAAGARAVFAD
ncbi:Na+/H+ antiporter NhaA [Peterkaempfera sp. SMS 1(5)a]|uniref:Na+/H+ antiporter NhaA n=1 Tax=Peterkaempfera podocarpi TaxID=3232308 RepID=UPI0036722802